MVRPRTIALLTLALALPLVPGPASAQGSYPPGYPVSQFEPESNLRLKVKPKEASVYVDGYFAGRVEEFDGVFERLHVSPGQHEIVVYLEGYRSLRQALYLASNKTRSIEGKLERLDPGESNEPPRPTARAEAPAPYRMPPPRSPDAQRGPPPPRAPPPGDREPDGPREPVEASRFGTLAIRVQPSPAMVIIDGERWTGPADSDERLIVQVLDGRHVIEVQREGYDRFVTEIEVRRGDTVPVNVSLTRAR